MLNRIAIIFACLAAFALFIPASSGAFGNAGQMPTEVRHRSFSNAEVEAMSRVTALIRTSLGEVRLKFFPEAAPNHVRNFIDLAKSGFYDRTAFHRVIPGFMIQGGDPNSKSPNRATHGLGGPPYVLKAEFSKLPHKRGTLSMARKASPDSAGSQFFICIADTPWLNGQYTVFGEVISGMDVVDKIVNQPRDRRDNPLERIEITVRILEQKPQSMPEKPKPVVAEEGMPKPESIGNKPAPQQVQPAMEDGQKDNATEDGIKEPAGEGSEE